MESTDSALPPRPQAEDRPKVPTATLRQARILIVDDEPANIAMLQRVLRRAGYAHLADTTDPTDALRLSQAFNPDLLCLDLNMPGLDGFGVLRQLTPVLATGTYLPILMLTGDSSRASKQQALGLGATDFVTKPFDLDEVLLRIHNLLVPRFLHLELERHNELLEDRVRFRTRELDDSRLEVLERLARAAEFRDDDTGQHTRRVGRAAAMLAMSVGMDEAGVELIRRAAPLHDVGKIGIPDQILLKRGKLTAEEFAVMRSHAVIGGEILGGGHTPLIQAAQEIALNHHERWDGTGYPSGRLGTEIPDRARIVALADVFDALTHPRPYREAWPLAKVLDEIAVQGGQHFDPELARAFLRLPHRDLL